MCSTPGSPPTSGPSRRSAGPTRTTPFIKKFYPTSVLVTGYDILFFWVTKMQLAGYSLTGSAPFHHIMLHGLVLDEHRQKMSKSKGNGIDPLGAYRPGRRGRPAFRHDPHLDGRAGHPLGRAAGGDGAEL